MKITKSQLKQIIKEELEAILEEDNLDEITSRTKAIARMRGVPHMGSGPLPKPEEPETEEERTPQGSDDTMRRKIETDMGLEPGSLQSGEELKQAEKERKEKAKSKPQTKSSKAAKRRPKYGHGGTHETWH